MNVLLTSAGRRNYLISYFKTILKENGLVIAVDVNDGAPALQEADRAFVVPSINSEGYIVELLKICTKNRVKLLIPLNDLELPTLAREKGRFLKIDMIPVISSPAVIDICYDKWETINFLSKIGLSAPRTYLNLEELKGAKENRKADSKFIVKPRWGSASMGIEYPEDDGEIDLAYRMAVKRTARIMTSSFYGMDIENPVLIQEKIIGQEYGLDIINDLRGGYVCTFVKKKLAMRAGETDRAVTVRDSKLEVLGQKIGQGLRHVGNLDCDVLVNDDGLFVLEMNPRFGGGYPFSHQAGANIPAALVAWADNTKPDNKWFKIKEGVVSAKCDRIIDIKTGKGNDK